MDFLTFTSALPVMNINRRPMPATLHEFQSRFKPTAGITSRPRRFCGWLARRSKCPGRRRTWCCTRRRERRQRAAGSLRFSWTSPQNDPVSARPRCAGVRYVACASYLSRHWSSPHAQGESHPTRQLAAHTRGCRRRRRRPVRSRPEDLPGFAERKGAQKRSTLFHGGAAPLSDCACASRSAASSRYFRTEQENNRAKIQHGQRTRGAKRSSCTGMGEIKTEQVAANREAADCLARHVEYAGGAPVPDVRLCAFHDRFHLRS